VDLNSDTFAARLREPGDEIPPCKSSKASIRDSWSKPVDWSLYGNDRFMHFHKKFGRESALFLSCASVTRDSQGLN